MPDSRPHAQAESIDKLWDYEKPAESEQRFRALLESPEIRTDSTHTAQVLTQIARSQGLQRKFAEAHRTLDEAERLLPNPPPLIKARLLLERGRAHNSNGEPEKASPLFLQAFEVARAADEDFYAVDAAHMMGIVESAKESLEWNYRAIGLAEKSRDPRARGWLGSLYNNTGWTMHDSGKHSEALDLFQKALELRQEKGDPKTIRIARWCVARCLRSLSRVEEAFAAQQALEKEFHSIGEQDGYVQEELGECLLLLRRESEAAPHFARAFAALSKDDWLARNEPNRIARLKELGQTR